MNTLKIKLGEIERAFHDLSEAKSYAESKLTEIRARLLGLKEEEKKLKRTQKLIETFLGLRKKTQNVDAPAESAEKA